MVERKRCRRTTTAPVNGMGRARRNENDENTSGGIQSQGEGLDGGKGGMLEFGAAESGPCENNNEVGNPAERTTPLWTDSADQKMYPRAGRTY